MKTIPKDIVAEVIVYLFILLFLYAATSKLVTYEQFHLEISKSPFITDYAHILAWLIPALEVIISILLMMKRTILHGLYASTALMWIFTAYILAILNFADHIPCACGGVLSQMSWSQHLLFNLFFVFLGSTGILLKLTSDKKSTANSAQ